MRGMAAPDPYAGTPEEFTINHWKECVANFRPSGPNSFSQAGGEAALTGLVPAAKIRGFLRFALGYNNVTPSSPYKLQRTNPVYHPRYTNLICTSAAEEEFKPGGRKTSDGGVPVAPLKVQANSAMDYENAPLRAAPAITHRSGYEKCRATLRFAPIEYPMADDDGGDKATEYRRNCWIDLEPRIEFLSLDGFQLIYSEGESNTPPLSNPKGKAFPAPFGQILVKPDVVMNWKHVPRRYCFVEDLPTNILRCVGKVNDTFFLTYKRGTLLLLGAKMTRTPWPLAAGTEDYWNYQIQFFFSYFNPTKGKTGNAPILTDLGHNNQPWRGRAVGDGFVGGVIGVLTAGDTNAGKWFMATRTGGSGGDTVDPRLIEYAEFTQMFLKATGDA